jgi:light-regulated signal transduction histidine kinase (bacteriophytochrome)
MLAKSGLIRMRQLEAESESQNLNSELANRIEERTAELASRTADLQRSNADLEQFAYAISHDLQEPLRMVHSYVQLLRRQVAGRLGPECDEMLAFAVDGAERMRAMIASLLTYSRISRQGGDPVPTDMNPVVATAMEDLRLAIDESGAEISNGRLPVIQGDASQLVRLMENLIGNALKYRATDRPPLIAISATPCGKEWRFAVKDNGIGIDSQHFNRIFGVFQRLHSPRDYPGTGVGLALCKRIVDNHGGKIWVESELGAGSTFLFTLPAVSPA